MGKLYCIGEVLIDMVNVDHMGLKLGVAFEKKAGGAPANVAASATRLGQAACFLGHLGSDAFGDYLHSMLDSYAIDTSLCSVGGVTTVALVGIDAHGERSFAFLRGSDAMYDSKQIILPKFDQQDVVHFGSATAYLDGALKTSYSHVMELAKQQGAWISFDPNYRDALILEEMEDDYRSWCKSYIAQADLVKVSEEELNLLTKETDVTQAVAILHTWGARMVCVTQGKSGTYLSGLGQTQQVSSISIKQIDTTGAGDAFIGALCSQLLEHNQPTTLSFDHWVSMVHYANIVGALTCTRHGAMEAIPTKAEVETYL
ncbi:MAG: carbohydrate kinase family protein [Erysipelotrichaceae bacterium]